MSRQGLDIIQMEPRQGSDAVQTHARRLKCATQIVGMCHPDAGNVPSRCWGCAIQMLFRAFKMHFRCSAFCPTDASQIGARQLPDSCQIAKSLSKSPRQMPSPRASPRASLICGVVPSAYQKQQKHSLLHLDFQLFGTLEPPYLTICSDPLNTHSRYYANHIINFT